MISISQNITTLTLVQIQYILYVQYVYHIVKWESVDNNPKKNVFINKLVNEEKKLKY